MLIFSRSGSSDPPGTRTSNIAGKKRCAQVLRRPRSWFRSQVVLPQGPRRRVATVAVAAPSPGSSGSPLGPLPPLPPLGGPRSSLAARCRMGRPCGPPPPGPSGPPSASSPPCLVGWLCGAAWSPPRGPQRVGSPLPGRHWCTWQQRDRMQVHARHIQTIVHTHGLCSPIRPKPRTVEIRIRGLTEGFLCPWLCLNLSQSVDRFLQSTYLDTAGSAPCRTLKRAPAHSGGWVPTGPSSS